jgi:hypothetical protein
MPMPPRKGVLGNRVMKVASASGVARSPERLVPLVPHQRPWYPPSARLTAAALMLAGGLSAMNEIRELRMTVSGVKKHEQSKATGAEIRSDSLRQLQAPDRPANGAPSREHCGRWRS